jgi:hypothetical protein
MKPNEAPAGAEAAPANLSTRQLAATLTKTAPDQTEAKAGAPEEPVVRETPDEPKGAEPDLSNTDKAKTEEVAAETAALPEETAETPAQEIAGETPALPGETPEEHAGEPPALPPEVLEAIEIAKAQDGGKGKADLLKRVHKLVDARDTERNARLAAEEAAKNLRQELQDARKETPAAAVPSGVHPAVAAVRQELANVDHWMGVCEDVLPKLQSGEMEFAEFPDGKGGTIKADEASVQRTLRELQDVRQETVARKVQTERDVQTAFESKFRESHASAVKRFPWIANPQSPESVQLKKAVELFPAIKGFPDYEIAMGHMFRSMALDAEAAAKAKTNGAVKKAAPAREPTKVSTTPPGGGVEEDEGGKKEAKQAESQFEKSHSTRDLAKRFATSRRASRTSNR